MLNSLRLALIMLNLSAFLVIKPTGVEAQTGLDVTVDEILTKSPFVKITDSQIESLVRKQKKAVLLFYAEPQNVGLPNNTSNRQAHRLADLYKTIAPNFPELKFYMLEITSKDHLQTVSRQFEVEGIPSTNFYQSGRKVFNFKKGPDNTEASINEFRSLLNRNLGILSRQ